ncbi:hypothetical protein RWA06_04655 [Sinorhizobium meliloti]|uniref:hypothetical protein n=1 Tax=Rhizobium meliloti TaxID=382 RepID=UPI00299E7EF7|nr:hypothetical protein [Sinorhizobium meliloti]
MKMTDKEREGFDVLRAEMPEALAMEIVEFRREKKAKITARIARALLREYKAFGNIEKAVETQMVRNWIGFEAEWMKPKGRTFHDSNNPMPLKTSANYGPAEIVSPPEPETPEQRARKAEMARRLRETAAAMRTVQ